jgi:cephalosporin hydroxylase
MPPYTDLVGSIWHTTYCGVPAVQSWQDFMLWEMFFNKTKPTCMVELGTFWGGLTLFLQHQCYSRGMTFYTIDFKEFADFDTPDGALYLNGTKALFHHVDMWTPEFDKLLDSIMRNEKGIVMLCDGGNKPKEMQTFTPRLRPGDYIACHDWGNEIADPDLESVRHLLSPVMPDECNEMKSPTRFFQRI